MMLYNKFILKKTRFNNRREILENFIIFFV